MSRKTPCGQLLDLFVSQGRLREIGVSDGNGHLLGVVERSRIFALLDIAGEEIFGTMPADRLLPGR